MLHERTAVFYADVHGTTHVGALINFSNPALLGLRPLEAYAPSGRSKSRQPAVAQDTYMRRVVGAHPAQSEVPALWTLVPDRGWCDDPIPAKNIFYSCPLVERQGYGRAHPTRFIVRPRTLAFGVQSYRLVVLENPAEVRPSRRSGFARRAQARRSTGRSPRASEQG